MAYISGENSKKPKLGTGKRFDKLEHELDMQPGVTDPAALAAEIGRKKYGKEKFQNLSKKGKGKK